jgi:methyl-accepting chemotaxis protein
LCFAERAFPAAPKEIHMAKSDQIAQESIFRSRISGERIIAVTRFILLIPLTLFAVFILLKKAAETGFAATLSEGTFIIELACILAVSIYSIWLLVRLRRDWYHNAIKYVSPFIDVSLLTLIVYINAVYPRSALIMTGAPSFLYFIFMALSVFRNSFSSVVFTGVYIALSYSALSLNSMRLLQILQGSGNVFTSVFSQEIVIDWDDELIKPLIFLISTFLLAYLARRFNRSIMDQTRVVVERENLKEVFFDNVKQVSGDLLSSGKTLGHTYTEFSRRIDGIVDSSRRIGEETNKERGIVDSTTDEVSAIISSIEAVTRNIHDQAALITQTVAAIEEMGGSIRTMTATSQKASEIARALLGAAQDGGQAVGEVNSAIAEASKESKKIEEIVDLISEIANKTNLLAMNASIEAAHAGKAGEGFAVIAGEIRNLAESSGASAKEVTGILKGISKRIGDIGTLAKQANQKLESIVGDAHETTNINTTIQNAMEEELRTVDEMMKSLRSLNGITEEVKNASSAQNEGSRVLLDSVTKLKSQADSVSSLIQAQMKACEIINGLSQDLKAVVAGNEKVIGRLEGLLKTI